MAVQTSSPSCSLKTPCALEKEGQNGSGRLGKEEQGASPTLGSLLRSPRSVRFRSAGSSAANTSLKVLRRPDIRSIRLVAESTRPCGAWFPGHRVEGGLKGDDDNDYGTAWTRAASLFGKWQGNGGAMGV